MVKSIPISELFGPTIQGEGLVVGRKSLFVRVYGCDYACSWCDSAFTWNGSEKDRAERLSVAEVIARLEAIGLAHTPLITITGGNPALYNEPIATLIDELQRRGKQVVVETQGSLWQDWFRDADWMSISPKPPSSGMQGNREALDEILSRLEAGKSYLKVVVFDEQDYEYAKKLHAAWPQFPFYLQVGNEYVDTPGDISANVLSKSKWLFEKVIADPELVDVRVLPQLHTLIWHNRRRT